MKKYTLIRSKRRSIGIYVSEKGVVVKAPLTIPQTAIEAFITNKTTWIEKKLSQLASIKTDFPKPSYESGSQIYIMGNPVTLQLSSPEKQNRHGNIYLQETTLTLYSKNQTPPFVRKQLLNWFKKQAQHLIELRLAHYHSQISHKKITLKIKTLKTRWGSCSSSGLLTFNWALIMAPLFVLDYVIVHELCHLLEMNHSKRFWTHVATHFPDYKTAIQWLKTKGPGLGLP